jgi:hypothetical protein
MFTFAKVVFIAPFCSFDKSFKLCYIKGWIIGGDYVKPLNELLSDKERMFVEHFVVYNSAQKAKKFSGLKMVAKEALEYLSLHIEKEKKAVSKAGVIALVKKNEGVASLDEVQSVLSAIVRESDNTRDKISAITLLHRITYMTPYETERIRIENEKLEIERNRWITTPDESESDGFIEALKGSVDVVWEEVETNE